MWLGYLAWGEDTAGYHLLSLFFHWLACLLLARFGFVYGISTTSGALLGGALFMVGIAHFRALVWVSALAYPLALCCVLAALLCLRHWLTHSGTLWLVGVYVFTFYGVLCHTAAASVFFVFIYLVAQSEFPRRFVGLFPIGVICALIIYSLVQTYSQAPQVIQQSDGFDIEGTAGVFLWLLSRLLTTSYFLPLILYEVRDVELFIGGALLASWLYGLYKGTTPPVVFFGGWIGLFLLPFLSRDYNFITQIHSGTGQGKGLDRTIQQPTHGHSKYCHSHLGLGRYELADYVRSRS
ncbi:MAG: hypothetical protein ACI906_001543 [Candidatus Latescibacterota bacterium]|jgi:hypothetical protein